MTNQQKAEQIKPWMNPEERRTVDFTDVRALNADVTGCTDNVVHLLFQEAFPHMKERMTVPLRNVHVEEDPFHYTGILTHLSNPGYGCALIKKVLKDSKRSG